MGAGGRAITSVLLGGAGVDGGVDGPGEPHSTWSEAIAVAKVVPKGIGAGLRDAPERLAEIVAGLGVDEVVVRSEWAAIEPEPGVVASEELARLGRLVGLLREAGLRTGIVLTDGSVPDWMGTEAWLTPAAPERLAAHAARLLDAVSGVDLLVTLEEPGTYAQAAVLVGAAPPFRVGALRDGIAMADAMLAGHLEVVRAVGEEPGAPELTWIASGDAGRLVEAALLGEGIAGGWASRVLDLLVAGCPGRTAELLELGVEPGAPILPFGSPPASPPGRLGALGFAASRAIWPIPSGAAGLSAGSHGIRLVHVDCSIDERGRVTKIAGQHRSAQIALGLEASRSPTVTRFVVGEATDRWRWGSFAAREGLIGVDRTRGRSGFELLETDSSLIDAAGELRALLRG